MQTARFVPMTFSARTTMADVAAGADLPAWVRIGCLAWAHADHNGHARLATGQLRHALDLTAADASRALAVARDRGWVDVTSTARCVVLPGCGHHSCDERHR